MRVYRAKSDGSWELVGIDKSLEHVPVKLFSKKMYVASPGAPVFITADVNDEKTFLK